MLKTFIFFFTLLSSVIFECVYSKHDFQKVFYIALRQQNLDVLKNHFDNVSNFYSPSYSQYLSSSYINSIVSPDKSKTNNLVNWLNSNNIKIIHNYGDSLICEGNIKDIDRAFDTRFEIKKTKNIYYTLNNYNYKNKEHKTNNKD